MTRERRELSGSEILTSARSLLFVPGNRPEWFSAASSGPADVPVFDLEDAIVDAEKGVAREHVVGWLSGRGRGVVRLNSSGSAHLQADLAAIAGLPGLIGVIVPKAEETSAVAEIGEFLGQTVRLVALIESAIGLHNVTSIAASSAVDRLAFGGIDFALDAGCDQSDEALLYARSSLVVASRVADLPGPIDGVAVELDDVAAVERSARAGARLGFKGKLCVHPNQVDAVNAAFSPTTEEIAWAHRVVDLPIGPGASRLEGRLVDKPVIARAQRLLREVRPHP